MPDSLPPLPPSELSLYLRVSTLAVIIFGVCYSYLYWLDIPSAINKSAADTAIILMGSSMILSGLCYFWNRFDKLIAYRKHLGLVGFAFAVAHLMLSLPALQALFNFSTWERGAMWPALSGVLALIIFTAMAVVSNSMMAMKLGGKTWRQILRTGYLAIILVWLHVVLLKSGRWLSWFEEGMPTAPSLSLLVSVFMVIVIGMRVALWWSLRRKKAAASLLTPSQTSSTIPPTTSASTEASIKSEPLSPSSPS